MTGLEMLEAWVAAGGPADERQAQWYYRNGDGRRAANEHYLMLEFAGRMIHYHRLGSTVEEADPDVDRLTRATTAEGLAAESMRLWEGEFGRAGEHYHGARPAEG